MSFEERTGWRDERISRRHRLWGKGCSMVDLDFLACEYNYGEPIALIEYKLHTAQTPDIKQASYTALYKLANGYKQGPLPFLVVFYDPDTWVFKVHPINKVAKDYFAKGEVLSEFEFVSRLYKLRNKSLETSLKNVLSTVMLGNKFTPPKNEDKSA